MVQEHDDDDHSLLRINNNDSYDNEVNISTSISSSYSINSQLQEVVEHYSDSFDGDIICTELNDGGGGGGAVILKSITSKESTLLNKSGEKILLTEKQPTSKQKENIKKKILVIILICNLAFPLYLAYNSPNSLVKVFDKHYNMDSSQFSKLYTVYALPNLFMVILGGILVDLFGPNKCSLVFQTILFLSTVLTAISVSNASYGLLLFSKVLLGIGGETILVCISAFIAKWFSANDVPFVLGLESSWVQIASLMSFAVLPSLYNASNLQFTMWFITIVSIIALVSNFVFVIFQKRLKFRDEVYVSVGDDIENEKVNQTNNINNERDNEKDDEELAKQKELESMTKTERLVYELKHAIILMKLIPKKMWILAGISFFGYNTFYGLDIFVTDMIAEKYNYDNKKASMVMAYETMVNGVMSPIFGYLVKRFEMRATACGIGIFFMGLGVALLNLTNNVPYPWVIISGLGYGLMNNSIMSSIPIIVEEKIIGSSYGLVGTAYNVGIFVFPYLLGSIRTKLGNYDVSMWVLVLSAVVALLLLGWLKLIDMKETDNSKRLDKKRS
ncbi:hypothetical protein PPL_08595 [Heterostelium album PN500]|uniref:Lysosomal dipeptide transporter MFSD1 n=1 Tax=Heterostelium pallidum (strain ATCC 26659 / Pp 5 / PN500) TaxID=670386 RepID=D3BJ70_HETP5|nr:hypothetical protein PPL_08595 [Heterostelium album PN500]EFA77950.1 hypothetical protein PPL_08595 [Heterostelium album PN500]|eukprot:XP_020430078.1 hypothetical protein PPL_08595 [Heterostelium album PN500]